MIFKISPKLGQLTRILIILIIFFYSHTALSQQYHSQENLVAFSDSILGPDNRLVQGKLYFQRHSDAGRHPFLFSEHTMDGHIFIAGKHFPANPLRYDLYQEVFILHCNATLSVQQICLDPTNIDSIQMLGRTFVPVGQLGIEAHFDGYVELIYRGDFAYFIKYRKYFKGTQRDNNFDPGKFSHLETRHYIFFNDNLIRVNSRYAFLRVFKTHKKAIRQFMKKNNIRYQNASSQQLQMLNKFCDELISN